MASCSVSWPPVHLCPGQQVCCTQYWKGISKLKSSLLLLLSWPVFSELTPVAAHWLHQLLLHREPGPWGLAAGHGHHPGLQQTCKRCLTILWNSHRRHLVLRLLLKWNVLSHLKNLHKHFKKLSLIEIGVTVWKTSIKYELSTGEGTRKHNPQVLINIVKHWLHVLPPHTGQSCSWERGYKGCWVGSATHVLPPYN